MFFRYLEETRSTLQFASRAKLVQTNATVNEVLDDNAKIKRLTRELNELKDMLKGGGLSAGEVEQLHGEKSELLARLESLQNEKEEQQVA